MSEENLNNEPTSDAPDEPEEQLAAEAEASELGGAGKRTLGLERWVQIGFIAFALLLVWLLGNLISSVWYVFADPDESIVTLASVVLGIVTVILLYRNRGVHEFATEIADELSKVTWPTRKETSNSTVIVVVTSVVAALMLFLFDSVWSAVTDLVYKV